MKRILLLITLFVIGIMTKAGEVTEQQALNKAQQFFKSYNKMTAARAVTSAKTIPIPRLVYVGTASNTSDEAVQASAGARAKKTTDVSQDTPSFYVFNAGDNSGFVIISGDDSADPVIGYSHSGTFDPDDIPDGLKWLKDSLNSVETIDRALWQGLSTRQSF